MARVVMVGGKERRRAHSLVLLKKLLRRLLGFSGFFTKRSRKVLEKLLRPRKLGDG